MFFTGQQDEVTENDQESAKAIVVSGWYNNINHQYLFDEKRWIKLNKFPESVGRISGIFETSNTCYVVGTKGISTLNNEFYKFPSNKIYDWCATCRVGSNILVFCNEMYGNVDGESKLFNTINKRWSDANINIKRKSFAVVYYVKKVWIIGGYERVDDGKWKTLKSVEIYDLVKEKQILVPIKMNKARSSLSAILYKNNLFVFGGYDYDGCNLLNTVEMFSPGTKKFVKMASMKIARSNFACCKVGNLVYIISGWITRSVEIYNLDSNTWIDGVDFPGAGHRLCACAVNDKL